MSLVSRFARNGFEFPTFVQFATTISNVLGNSIVSLKYESLECSAYFSPGKLEWGIENSGCYLIPPEVKTAPIVRSFNQTGEPLSGTRELDYIRCEEKSLDNT